MAVLVADNENIAEQFRRYLSFLPRITGDWAESSLYFGNTNIEGGDAPRRVAFSWPNPGETQRDYLESYIVSNGAEGKFEWEDKLPEDWDHDSL